ncbi:CDP-alcohol phosphatidyltransferase family protein [Brooklawnia cerclae]|uniref:Cardiolipin synthase n=1 Tax=Brooklawnia cerclae TaxID=349934 RepID=A0ABX0SEM0_9ACTN|nr:cardiolipin synthase [Brooklawnia cerclae]
MADNEQGCATAGADPSGQPAVALTPEHQVDTHRVWTVPNVLSFLRLIGVPFFFVLIMQYRDFAAIIFLAIASFTDLIDGRIARRFHQISELGEMLDPAADRLYILATVLGLAVRGIIPWWLLALLVGRDLMILLLVPALRSRGYTSLPVNFIGKAATFCLLYALPLVLLGAGPWVFSLPAKVLGWAMGIWGTFLYWWAGFLYVKQTRQILAAQPALRKGPA